MKTFLKSFPVVGGVLKYASQLLRKYRHWRVDPHRHLQRIFAGRKKVCIVQVGSNDGSTNDPIFRLLKANVSWEALLIEPVPFLFERLKKNYSGNANIRFANTAITEKEGFSMFYYVNPIAKEKIPDLPWWFDQLGSFNSEHIVKHLGKVAEPYIIAVDVPTSPLETVLNNNQMSMVSLLHIDAEGYDWIILSQLDFSKTRPEVILFEHKHLSVGDKKQAVDRLRGNNYRVTDLGADFLCRSTSLNTRG